MQGAAQVGSKDFSLSNLLVLLFFKIILASHDPSPPLEPVVFIFHAHIRTNH